jgi:fumarate hydratase subunit beta
MEKHKAVYFGAIGGAAALIAKCITAAEIVCYEDLGAEAIRRLTVKDFPATVVIDSFGNNLYTIGVEKYLKTTGNNLQDVFFRYR